MFCTSVHGGPVILPAVIFRLRSCRIRVHWWEVLTAKGKALIKFFVKEYTPAEEIDKEQYLASVPTVSMLIMYVEVGGAFGSPVWKQQSERCLGCGACAYVCPTCACFVFREDAKVVRSVSVVGILAALLFRPSIRRTDNPRLDRQSTLALSAFCTSSPYALNGYRKPIVPDAGVGSCLPGILVCPDT